MLFTFDKILQSYLIFKKTNKKFELMLTRCAKAYSSSSS